MGVEITLFDKELNATRIAIEEDYYPHCIETVKLLPLRLQDIDYSKPSYEKVRYYHVAAGAYMVES